MFRTRLSRPDLDDPVFHARWQALALATGASAFQSWTWVGCLAAERYPDPLLAEVFEGDALAGLALFNRRGGALHLHASGDPALDSVFIEHNGPVATRAGAWPAMLAAVRREAGRVVLPGLDDAGLAAVQAAGGIVVGQQIRVAPYAALGPTPYAEGLSRNTRSQLRRSDRSYAAAGALVAERASDVAQAIDWLDAMVPLHEATWSGRGVASGFLTAPVQRFTRALIARGVPTGEVDVLRVTAGPRLVGYLLNLVAAGRVLAYQGGFDYAGAGPHEKPGLSCHHAALERARALGAVEYDFLAGDARYKRSLSNGVRDLHWLTWKPRPMLFGLEALIRKALGRLSGNGISFRTACGLHCCSSLRHASNVAAILCERCQYRERGWGGCSGRATTSVGLRLHGRHSFIMRGIFP
jgi:CelD/BcsL family acetyltransferase involved in cellulose biosynthesis